MSGDQIRHAPGAMKGHFPPSAPDSDLDFGSAHREEEAACSLITIFPPLPHSLARLLQGELLLPVSSRERGQRTDGLAATFWLPVCYLISDIHVCNMQLSPQ